jgi:D-sedoheptulose 7-phosphate isomerase
VTLPVAMLAGGLATRLRPITETIPKALVDVAGRPFAEHQAALLRRQGVTRIVWLVSYRAAQIEAVLGDGQRWGMRFEYLHDGPILLGTGGAIQRALPQLGDAFFVMYGDSYLECDFAAVEAAFRASGRSGLMTVFRNDGQYDTSNVEFAAGQIVRYDKNNRTAAMRHIDYGLGILTPAAFAPYVDGQPLDLARVYQDLLAAGQLAAFEVSERFYEIGSPEGLADTEAHLRSTLFTMTYSQQHLAEVSAIIQQLDTAAIERVAEILAAVRHRGGRLFFLGVGGSAGNCSHAVNDFRKLAAFEAYTPTDNVSELTARTNDEGWETVFIAWLKGSRLRREDGVFVFSVGGGSLEKNISANLVRALQYAHELGTAIVGVVGRDGGYTAQVADACVIVPTVNPETVTPHSEAFQAVVWHLLVSHPLLKAAATKWESTR